MDLVILYISVLVLYFVRVLKEFSVNCEIQSFVVQPTNTQVIEGQTTTLHCQVSYKNSTVQWSKDGFILGSGPKIPGSNYTVIGDSSLGIYNLKIEDATLEDEGDYECQVGPVDGLDPIAGRAHITVLLQPTSIEIVGKENGSKVQVNHGDKVKLECIVKGGKPAPQIAWLKNLFKLSDDQSRTSVSNEDDGRQTATSTLEIYAHPGDNKANYTCEASTEFSERKLNAFIMLDVLFPPDRPVIEDFRGQKEINSGDSISMKCVSHGGNPLPSLVWYVDGKHFDHSYTTSEKDATTTNEISFTAGSSDDGATYTCSAIYMAKETLNSSITLQVLYAPESVKITAPEEAKPGDLITATCKAGRSNPVSKVIMLVDGIQLPPFEDSKEKDSNGGWMTTYKISINITEKDKTSKDLVCYVINQEWKNQEIKSDYRTVSILYAPNPPVITGYDVGTALTENTVLDLTCRSHGGNPLPELKWYKNDKELPTTSTQDTGPVNSKTLKINVQASDNGAEYQCKSTSKALTDPLTASVSLNVQFPPKKLLPIKVKPKKPKAGSQVKLTCECSSSNPAANISWWLISSGAEEEVLGQSFDSVTPADNQGFSTKSELRFNVTAENDGSKFKCKATNEAVHKSLHDAVVLTVLYKPIFKIADQPLFEVKENDSSVIDITAKGNPDEISYTWKKGDETIWDGPVFNITSAERSLTGTYVCLAKNEVGESSLTINLKVLYPMTIISITNDIIADPKSDVRLECAADGYPLPENAITWKRSGDGNMDERTETVPISNGKSVLVVKNIARDIAGDFICEAKNGVGSSDSRKVILLVKHKPIIQDIDSYKTVFSDRKKSAELQCKAEGVPDVRFGWSKEGVILTNKTARMRIETFRVDHHVWKGVLTIQDVNITDYGEYYCVAKNDIDFATAKISLMPDGAPDPPSLIYKANVTSTAIFIRWIPGFSGGHNQTYTVRCKSSNSTYVVVDSLSGNSAWIRKLEVDTEYEISMQSKNDKGSSLFSHKIYIKTLDKDGKDKSDETLKDDDFSGSLVNKMLIASIGSVFFSLLVFNIVLLAMYYRKKKPKPGRRYSEDDSISSMSVTSQVESEETTFSSFTNDSRESGNIISSYSSGSVYSEYKSATRTYSYESRSDEYSDDYSSATFSKPYPSSKFI